MRRLSPPAAALHRTLAFEVPCTPCAFDALARETMGNSAQAAARCHELAVRFSHQLERLRLAAAATAPAPASRAGTRALNVLLALHVDTVQKFYDHAPLLERLLRNVCTKLRVSIRVNIYASLTVPP